MTVTARLARPELDPLVDELARRFSAGRPPVTLTLRDMPAGARHALADLLGLDRVPRPSGRVDVQRLLAALGLETSEELREAVEALRGPVPDRRVERLAERAARERLWAWLAEEASTLSLGSTGWAGPWVERLRSQGVPGGVETHRRRLEQALNVLRDLPADGVHLAAFANDHLGDPHGLDRGRRSAAMVLDAVSLATGGAPAPSDAEATRHVWESVGVYPDPLSSTVLTLGLTSEASSPLGPWLAAAAAVSEPVVLTLAQIRRWPLSPLPAASHLYVVENPSLVAEAAATGWSGPPVVCSSGRPTVAVATLLRQLGAQGAAMLQHADFDATGLGITAWLADRAGTVPWRMTADDYGAFAGRGAKVSTLGNLPETPWDPELQQAMGDAGVVVYEEELRAELLTCMKIGRTASTAVRTPERLAAPTGFEPVSPP